MKDIITNSKHVKKGSIFLPTAKTVKDEYLIEAINKKAALLILDKDFKAEIPIIKVKDRYKTLFDIYNNYYNDPLIELNLIGITGTDGKTTTATMIKDLLNNLFKTSYLGTNGFSIDNYVINTKNTTPSINEILHFANITKEQLGKCLVMEVSSEGLFNKRCEGLLFDVVIFTNIDKEHLNVHKSFANYLECKKDLFRKRKKDGISIINKDDKYYKDFKCLNKRNITIGKKHATYTFSNIRYFDDYTLFDLKYKRKKYTVKSPFLGEYNVYNLCSSIAVANLYFKDLDKVISLVSNLKAIKGRGEVLDFNQNFKIVLDYAHTTQATLEILSFYKNKINNGRIITVVGCAGNRYQDKRALIGKIVSDLSDIAIFTMDDPRWEDLNDIFKSMTTYVKDNVLLIKNRKKAIRKALKLAKSNDLVLILGKGRDNYMAYKDKMIPYSDYEVIKNYFK